MADPNIDTLAPASDPEVVTWEQKRDHMVIRVYPEQHSRFVVYDGTAIEATKNERGVQLTVEDAPISRRYTWRIHGSGTALSVVQNSEELPQFTTWEEFSQAQSGWYQGQKALHIKSEKGRSVSISVVY